MGECTLCRLGVCLVAILGLASCTDRGKLLERYEPAGGGARAHVLFVAGRDSHGPWAHEHRDGSLLLAAALHEQYPDYAVDVIYGGWPTNESLLDKADTIVIYSDGGAGHPIIGHLQRFRRLLDDDVGVVALHYAVEVPAGTDAAGAMLRAIGGYFETHWSVNPHWEAAFDELPTHPVTHGIAPFRMRDEWYFNMRFQSGIAGVTPILSAVAPLHTMEREDGPHSGNPAVREQVAAGMPQIVAWAYERPGGGRGFGYTGGHYHANWKSENARQVVLNAIAWTAGGSH